MWTLWATNLVITTQMPCKDGGMQQLPQNRTLRESVSLQNGQLKNTKSYLSRSNTQRRGRKRTGRNPTSNPNQQRTKVKT